VALLQSAGKELEVAALDGPSAGKVAGLVEVLERDLAEAQDTDEVVVVHAGSRRGVGTTVLVPLRTHLAPSGVLLVALESRVSLDPDELGLLSAYADQASLALDRAQALVDREELLLVADRDRIARDLHDLVIQRLFATGLQLQGAIRNAVNEDVKQRLQTAVVDLDTTIRDIRSTIFELQHSRAQSLRAEVRAVVKEYVPVLGFSPLVRTAGPVDSVVPEDLAAQLLAVLRETLSNVARHAEAEAAVVEVEANDGHVVLRVTDNGKGLPEERHESGLRNVRRRAVEQGGTVNMLPEEPHGTRVEWIVPLPG